MYLMLLSNIYCDWKVFNLTLIWCVFWSSYWKHLALITTLITLCLLYTCATWPLKCQHANNNYCNWGICNFCTCTITTGLLLSYQHNSSVQLLLNRQLQNKLSSPGWLLTDKVKWSRWGCWLHRMTVMAQTVFS